ncbi:MAG: V-type ATP synthase subunit E [Anaerococcus sp.]|nr:V-type ATP synthase subunit E [Anaerococcus sp.]MDD7045387.1 V-type ATP synthase subunit E [Peptoniphilaceae bacterium]MDY2919110.1 V-type ATP synthase subunit E [Anaerococcus sp.]
MGNLDLILESIIEKGKAEEKEILDTAHNEAEKIISEKTSQAKKEADQILTKANERKKSILENEKVSSKRIARDIGIGAKNQVIDQVIEKLIEELKNMDDESYKKFVLNSLKAYDGISGVLILQYDKKDALDENDLPKGIKIDDGSVDEGFIIRDKDVEYNNTYTSLIKYNIDDIKKKISDDLFK